jgi:hypothetical protein
MTWKGCFRNLQQSIETIFEIILRNIELPNVQRLVFESKDLDALSIVPSSF